MAEQYWFNTATNEVETGHRSPWNHLMGPYPTFEAAAAALSAASQRSQDWDEEDREWQEGR